MLPATFIGQLEVCPVPSNDAGEPGLEELCVAEGSPGCRRSSLACSYVDYPRNSMTSTSAARAEASVAVDAQGHDARNATPNCEKLRVEVGKAGVTSPGALAACNTTTCIFTASAIRHVLAGEYLVGCRPRASERAWAAEGRIAEV